MPPSLGRGITAGIGLFLVVIALKEVGAVSAGPIWIKLGTLWSMPMLLLIIGALLIATLLHFGIDAAFILAILALWAVGLAIGATKWQGVVSWPPSLKPTFFAFDFRVCSRLICSAPYFRFS